MKLYFYSVGFTTVILIRKKILQYAVLKECSSVKTKNYFIRIIYAKESLRNFHSSQRSSLEIGEYLRW